MSNERKSPKEGIEKLRELGSAWNNIICVCRELMKDQPCECNCAEFNDESLPNYYQLVKTNKP